MHNSVTPALAAILNQMTQFSLLSSSLWPHSPGGTQEYDVTLWNTCIFFYTVPCTPMSLLSPNQPFFSGTAMHSQRKGKLPWIGCNFCSIDAQDGEISHLSLKTGWPFLIPLPPESSFGSNRSVHESWQKNSDALGSVSISMYDRQRTSWCVRWHSKQDHCTAASAEQNYYFLLLLSACELKPQVRLVSVVGKEKEAQTCFHAL